MKSVLTWTGEMKFEATAEGKSVVMDAKSPIGRGSAQTPKELVLDGLGGCTAMDVMALLKKHKQPLESFEVSVEVETTKAGHPVVFTQALITFHVTGTIDPKILLESVQLSQTKYCGVSAMLSKAFPIKYVVILNNEEVGQGQADFGVQAKVMRHWGFMKVLKIALVMSLLLGHVMAYAHGEDKPGPHGGEIRMPGAFHTEVLSVAPNKVKVYLLDINLKSPTVSDSTVEASFKDHQNSNVICEKEKDAFLCSFDESVNLKSKGTLVIKAIRKKQKATATAEYKTPLK